MARQPKTAAPKPKFASSKAIPCAKCGTATNTLHLGYVKGVLKPVCDPTKGCPTA